MTEFKASLDKLAIGITIFVTMLFSFLIYIQVKSVNAGEFGIGAYVVSGLLLLVYVGAYIFRPIKYSVTETGLIIHRPISDVKLSKRHIEKIEILDSRKMFFAVRTFGVGGLFGYYGKFYDSGVGGMTWYVTRQNKCVMITTDRGKRIVISPDEPEKLIAALEK